MKNILILFSLVVLLSGFTLFSGKYKEIKDRNGIITIPVSDIKSEKATFYEYDYRGKKIKFFLLKTKDGMLKAAFDACDVCYPAKKGYSQSGDYMICNNCGLKFHITKIGLYKGGCNPSPLNFKLEKGGIIITVNELVSHYNYF